MGVHKENRKNSKLKRKNFFEKSFSQKTILNIVSRRVPRKDNQNLISKTNQQFSFKKTVSHEIFLTIVSLILHKKGFEKRKSKIFEKIL